MGVSALALSGALGAASCALFILALRPLLQRYALARPNARSSHVVPTAQGGGIAVMAATLLAVAGTGLAGGALTGGAAPLKALAAAALLLAGVGGIDDLRPLPAAPRLVLQACAAALTVGVAVSGPVLPGVLPRGIETVLLVIGLVWFVNLTNFMDGLDGMTICEIVPLAGLIAGFGLAGIVPAHVAVVAAALGGALLGFAPFNRPVASLFLGDVGSLPIGLLAGWMLIELAIGAGVIAALLPPLYYLADTGITLARRAASGARIWEAHRSHFYQRATANGFSVLGVDCHVLLLNLALCGLSALAVWQPSPLVQAAALAIGVALVGAVLARFARGPGRPA